MKPNEVPEDTRQAEGWINGAGEARAAVTLSTPWIAREALVWVGSPPKLGWE